MLGNVSQKVNVFSIHRWVTCIIIPWKGGCLHNTFATTAFWGPENANLATPLLDGAKICFFTKWNRLTTSLACIIIQHLRTSESNSREWALFWHCCHVKLFKNAKGNLINTMLFCKHTLCWIVFIVLQTSFQKNNTNIKKYI